MAQWSWPGSRETGSSTAVGPRVQPNMSKTPKRRMRTGGCIEGGAPYSTRDSRCESKKAVAMAPAKLADEERALSHSRAFNAMSVPPLTMKGGIHRLRRRDFVPESESIR